MRTLVPFVLVLGLLGAADSSAASPYPVSARMRMAPKDQQHCPTIDRQTDCYVLDAVRAAFGDVVARMFQTSATPALDLVVEVRNAEISRVQGLRFELSTRVRVLAPGGEVIDQIDADADVPLLAEEEGLIANAARNAAEDAARVFEREYSNDSNVGEYLVSKKVGSAAEVGVRERSERLVTLGVGGGFVQGGGDNGVAVAPSLRVAVAYRRFFLQGVYSHYASSFQGINRKTTNSFPTESDLTTNDLGFEAGAIFRFTPTIELRAGPGIHFLFGDATTDPNQGSGSQSFSKAAPTLFATISSSFFVSRKGPRFVFGAEARAYFFSSVDLPDLLRTVPAANTSFAILLGVELPWASQTEGAK